MKTFDEYLEEQLKNPELKKSMFRQVAFISETSILGGNWQSVYHYQVNQRIQSCRA